MATPKKNSRKCRERSAWRGMDQKTGSYVTKVGRRSLSLLLVTWIISHYGHILWPMASSLLKHKTQARTSR
jgi:hypothetical protein